MRKILYHVASTLDGFIAHEDGSVHGFAEKGEHVEDYLNSLQQYDTVLMGRKTYEFGYAYGLEKGRAPYTHMQNYVFSHQADFKPLDENLHLVQQNQVNEIRRIKAQPGTDIYLCGGGSFAQFLLEHRLIDELKLKLSPVFFHRGIRIFGKTTRNLPMRLISQKTYDDPGVLLLHYEFK